MNRCSIPFLFALLPALAPCASSSGLGLRQVFAFLTCDVERSGPCPAQRPEHVCCTINGSRDSRVGSPPDCLTAGELQAREGWDCPNLPRTEWVAACFREDPSCVLTLPSERSQYRRLQPAPCRAGNQITVFYRWENEGQSTSPAFWQ